MPGVITRAKTITINAGTEVGNLLTDTQYTSLPIRGGAHRLYASQTGADPGDVQIDAWFGNLQWLDGTSVQTSTTGTKRNEHEIGQQAGDPSDPVRYRVKNNDAVNNSTFSYILDMAI